MEAVSNSAWGSHHGALGVPWCLQGWIIESTALMKSDEDTVQFDTIRTSCLPPSLVWCHYMDCMFAQSCCLLQSLLPWDLSQHVSTRFRGRSRTLYICGMKEAHLPLGHDACFDAWGHSNDLYLKKSASHACNPILRAELGQEGP